MRQIRRHPATQINTDRWCETLEAVDQARRGEVIDGREILKWLATWGSEVAAKDTSGFRRANPVTSRAHQTAAPAPQPDQRPQESEY